MRWKSAALGIALFVAPVTASAFVWPNVPEQVARSLQSSDVSERRLAAQRIVELPPEIAAPLVQKAATDPDPEVRLRVAQAAVVLRIPRAGDLVVSWLSESDARIRLAACDVIHAEPTDRAVTALGRVLGDPDAHVRLAAASAMGNSGLADAVSPLLGHLDDQAPEVRAEVARALGRLGDARAVVPLIGKVQDGVSDVRKAACRALGELGEKRAVSALMLALQDGSHEVRVEALGALGALRANEATVAIAPLVDTGGGVDLAPSIAGLIPGGARASASSPSAVEVRMAAVRALGRIGSDAAIKALITSLAKDDFTAQRSPVRDALVAAGKPAIPALSAALSGSPAPSTAAGAALALGELGAKEALDPIVRGMQRGVVPLRVGLAALANIGSSSALPTVLELIDDTDPSVRKEAVRTAAALLDPAKGDGRAVDPANAALADPSTPLDERVELVRLLGHTGAPRAQQVLLSLSRAKQPALKTAVLDALGMLRTSSPEVDKALTKALEDDAADVRLHAAMALANVATPQTAAALLDRLLISAEQDRGAIGIALAGAMARVTDAAFAERVRGAVATAPEVARDALIEGLGRMRGPAAAQALSKLATGGIDDRRKAAEALGAHTEARPTLRVLVGDADPGVRANAVWSLGAVGARDDLAAVAALLADPDVAVAGNAAGAVGRIAARDPSSAAAAAPPPRPLCAALADARPYVRTNALEALSLAAMRCDTAVHVALLTRDPSEPVRLAAADYATRAIARGDADAAAYRRALTRCWSDDKNATVARRCAHAASPLASERDDVSVFVVPDGKGAALPRAPFTLVRSDGLLRMGIADRRGELFEFAVPRGTIELGVPAALAR